MKEEFMGEIIISIFVGGCMVAVGVIIRIMLSRDRKRAEQETCQAEMQDRREKS
jgi:hypothetical protein